MTEPDRIWINDKWEAYLRPTFDGDTSGYVRADLARPTPLAEALAVPTQRRALDALRDAVRKGDMEAACGALDRFDAALRGIGGGNG